MKKIVVQGIEINISTINNQDFISLTDMVRSKENQRAADIIKNWLRNRGTLEFLGAWESIYNPEFKVVEFDHFKKEAGLPTFTLSVSSWVEKTNAIGIFSKLGKLGGTYAHKDIAFEFGSAISPLFKLHIIKEYQRLKEIENNQFGIEWNVKRILSKVNYKIHTESIKNNIINKSNISQNDSWLIYADEADLINMVIFKCTAKEWRENNPKLAVKGENLRDSASINELTILSNIESLNAVLISKNLSKVERYKFLSEVEKNQNEVLKNLEPLKEIKNLSSKLYIDNQTK